jgi:DNA-nicking Smr family endonuclease
VKRPLRPEEAHLWAKVAATVRPAAARKRPSPTLVVSIQETLPAVAPPKPRPEPAKTALTPSPRRATAPEGIEPRRKRRISREQELGPSLDLHGLDQDRARAVLAGFLRRAREDGWRAVLVITGKGSRGDGVLRRMVPHWLADPALRDLIAGVSEAHRHHGGAGALYVALKRRKT